MFKKWATVVFLFTLIAHAWAKQCQGHKLNNLDFKDDGKVEFNRSMWVAPHFGPISLRFPKQWNPRLEVNSDDIDFKEMAKASMKKDVTGKIIIDLPNEFGVTLGQWIIGPTQSTGAGNGSSWSRLLKFQIDNRFKVTHLYSCKSKSGLGIIYKERKESLLAITDQITGLTHMIGETSVYRIKNDILRDVYDATLMMEENTYEIR